MGFPRRTFVHCGGFAPAAPRRVWNLVSGSISGLLLSQPVPIMGLVGLYPTNYLISRRPILRRIIHFKRKPLQESLYIRYYPQFPRVMPVLRVSYPRVTEPFAMIKKIIQLAWLNRIPIAVASARIKRIYTTRNFIVNLIFWQNNNL